MGQCGDPCASLVREVDGLGERVLAARVEGVDGRVVALLVPQHEQQLRRGAIQCIMAKIKFDNEQGFINKFHFVKQATLRFPQSKEILF